MIDRVSVLERIHRICDLLEAASPRSFEDLVEAQEGATRAFVIATFLALLEMARLRMIRVHQVAHGGAIVVSRAGEGPSPPTHLTEDYR